MTLSLLSRLVAALVLASVATPPPLVAKPQAPAPEAGYDPSLYQAMSWRCIGPYRGGRVTAVAGVPGDPLVYYMGATGGGVWKTEDAGLTWEAIADGFLKTGSVGAIAVSRSDPNVLYVGMGEACVRGNFSHGDGVYRSLDAGKTWVPMGLAESRQIGRILIHPSNPDLVYVAALGHVFGPGGERGVYRSADGGQTWQRILYKDEETGAVDLAMDPLNSRVIYAALWQVRRSPWELVSGGAGSGLYKSTDGGVTWKELEGGLPEGLKGRIGVSASTARRDRVWAIVEASDGGVFRSDDAGETWTRVNEDRSLRQRAWYYSHIEADPRDPDTVYVLNVQLHKSSDGGRTTTTLRIPHVDNHALWIAPEDGQRMILGNDGGACVTLNGGKSWSSLENQPTAQFYHVTTDNRHPYHVYGAQQDNSTVCIASRTEGWGIGHADWHDVGGGESGFIAPHPVDPQIVYAGSYDGYLSRYDHRTRQTRDISVWPESPMGWGAAELKYRFQWTFPILVSRHDPSVLYAAGNVLFMSADEGQSWTAISPDLTRDDKGKQGPSGGPITHDNTSVEYYGTIFALSESPHRPGEIWTGTDDGLVHLTRDGGRTWRVITPDTLAPWSLISSIELSPHAEGAAYLAVNRYKLDDFKPFIYKTADYGDHWELIVRGLPEKAFVRAVREDPKRRGLLYAGTETGVYVSFDDGAQWQPLQLNLPVVPITDLVVKEDDLVVATQGRSFWILDDLTPLQQMSEGVASSGAHLFKPRPAVRSRGWSYPRPGFGQNPPNGVVVHYTLQEEPKSPIALVFLEEDGEVIRRFASDEEIKEENEELESLFPSATKKKLPAQRGMNRFVWDMRYPGVEALAGAVLWAGDLRGPRALPGRYLVRLEVGEATMTQSFEITSDPRLEVTPAELRQQFELLVEIRDRIRAAYGAVRTIRSIRAQVDSLVARLLDAETRASVEAVTKPLLEGLGAIEEEIVQVRSKSAQDPLNYPIKIDNKLASLAGVVASAEAAPTDQAREVFAELKGRLDAELAKLAALLEQDVPALNALVKKLDVPAVLAEPLEGTKEP
ncbi:MAG: glycosyl hydrolase [Planctomycetota bacterium]